MSFIHLATKTLNEQAIALIDWRYHSRDLEAECVRIFFTSGESLYLDLDGLDAEILRSHFRLMDAGGVMASAEELETELQPESEEVEEDRELALASAQSSLDDEIPF